MSRHDEVDGGQRRDTIRHSGDFEKGVEEQRQTSEERGRVLSSQSTLENHHRN